MWILTHPVALERHCAGFSSMSIQQFSFRSQSTCMVHQFGMRLSRWFKLLCGGIKFLWPAIPEYIGSIRAHTWLFVLLTVLIIYILHMRYGSMNMLDTVLKKLGLRKVLHVDCCRSSGDGVSPSSRALDYSRINNRHRCLCMFQCMFKYLAY
jgi:hypothetical protein